jgi:hypothetical protein
LPAVDLLPQVFNKITIVGHLRPCFRFDQSERQSAGDDEKHGVFAASNGSGLQVGDSVALVPGYSPPWLTA